MKIKAILFAAAIFGASFLVSSTSENNSDNDQIQKQAIDRSAIRVPSAG